MAGQVTYHSFAKNVMKTVEDRLRAAADVIGGKAESYAKQYITEQKAVDTGLLRNSITYGIEGEKTHVDSYHADRGDGAGSYGGTVEKTEDNAVVIALGSNVEYAPYIELGTRARAEGANGQGIAGGIAPRPYIRPAIENHREEYKEVVEKMMGGA